MTGDVSESSARVKGGMEISETFQTDIDNVLALDSVTSILEVVRQTTGMRFVAVARVTEDRWIACQVHDDIEFGLKSGGELQIETTMCNEIRQSRQHVAIDDVPADTHWATHHTPKMYGFRSYISTPIILRDGSFFGTLCAIDPMPAEVNNRTVEQTFKLFANLIGTQLDARTDLLISNGKLEAELEMAELRDQFLAVVAHDIRNPLASISAGARMLSKEADGRSRPILTLMRQSVDRMSSIVDNLLDFARGRMGGGIGLNLATANLSEALEQIVGEHRSSYPDNVIDAHLDLGTPVFVDPVRVGQMFGNLVGNALAHGDPTVPITVRGRIEGEVIELSVANGGHPIPDEAREMLFHPFKRRGGSQEEGLGLGLYIADQIAKAHGGSIDVVSDFDQTIFTCRLPYQVSIADV